MTATNRTAHRNHNYVIGTLELADGRVTATARGRDRHILTSPAGTTSEAAALALATKIEGGRIAEVRCLASIIPDGKADWAVYVTH